MNTVRACKIIAVETNEVMCKQAKEGERIGYMHVVTESLFAEQGYAHRACLVGLAACFYFY